jgi:hypothetical protein
MAMRRILTMVLSVMLAGVPTFVSALQNTGTLQGTAVRQIHGPYNRYIVRARNLSNREAAVGTIVWDTALDGQIVGSVPLDANGHFSLGGLLVPGTFLVELYDVEDEKIVCTEGPFVLTGGEVNTLVSLNINIVCGRPPAALLLAGLAGLTAASVALADESNDQ